MPPASASAPAPSDSTINSDPQPQPDTTLHVEPLNAQQQFEGNQILVNQPIIGLKLTKSQSLLDSINARLSQPHGNLQDAQTSINVPYSSNELSGNDMNLADDAQSSTDVTDGKNQEQVFSNEGANMDAEDESEVVDMSTDYPSSISE